MTTNRRFEPSSIRNKLKREEVSRKHKRAKRQEKLQKRLALAKQEANDPLAKKKRLAENVPRTLDNTRDYDPNMITIAKPTATEDSNEAGSSSAAVPAEQNMDETELDLTADAYADYFSSAFDSDPSVPPKVLVTTSCKATKLTYDFCNELVDVLPGGEFIRRKKGKGFEIGHIAVWAAKRGYTNMIVVNEDMKKPSAITMIHLPKGPSAYFKLSSVQLSKQISGHARSTSHFPELVLNNFVTRLGHNVGRMFQTLFPPIPEFQGRQVVTLHNQRDFLFFRRHRYAFRSSEKAGLQEIGPRFTLKLRWIKKGTPAVKSLGRPALPLELGDDDENENRDTSPGVSSVEETFMPPTEDEFIWMWKSELETTRRTFFL